MKFDITIKDATAADLTAIANVLNGQLDVKPALQRPIESAKADVEKKWVAPESEQQQIPMFEQPAAQPNLPVPPVSIAPKQDSEDASVDSTGLPWDERIHSSTKALNKDGTWKKRRGVPELTVDKVEAELRGVAVDDTPAPAMPQLPPLPQQQATPPAMPQLPPIPQQTRDFNNALTRIQSGFKDGKMNANTIKEISEALGVSSITDINGNEDLVVQAHTLLDGYGV